MNKVKDVLNKILTLGGIFDDGTSSKEDIPKENVNKIIAQKIGQNPEEVAEIERILNYGSKKINDRDEDNYVMNLKYDSKGEVHHVIRENSKDYSDDEGKNQINNGKGRE